MTAITLQPQAAPSSSSEILSRLRRPLVALVTLLLAVILTISAVVAASPSLNIRGVSTPSAPVVESEQAFSFGWRPFGYPYTHRPVMGKKCWFCNTQPGPVA